MTDSCFTKSVSCYFNTSWNKLSFTFNTVDPESLRVRDSEIGTFTVMNVNIKTELCKTSLQQWDPLTARAMFVPLSTSQCECRKPRTAAVPCIGTQSALLRFELPQGEDQPAALVRCYGSPGCSDIGLPLCIAGFGVSYLLPLLRGPGQGTRSGDQGTVSCHARAWVHHSERIL